MRYHEHSIDCYASNEHGPLAYTPCRADGLDRNLRNLKTVDFHGGREAEGLTLVCTKLPLTPHERVTR